MKLILLAASAALMFGQEAKVTKPADTPQPSAVSERSLTAEESLKIENSILRIALAQKEFRIDEYQKAIAPDSAAQEEVISAACKSVGIPADLVKAQCGLSGFGADGKQPLGQDGKPVPRRVWWQKPVVSAADALKQPEKK